MKSTSCATILVIIVLSIGLLPIGVTLAADSLPVKLYVDESRSLQLGIQVWKGLKPKDGFFQTRVMASPSFDLLKQYDVMIIWNQIETFSYSQSELEAIRKFVEAGGGLLLLGSPTTHALAGGRGRRRKVLFKDARPLPFNDFSMNQIADMFGVQFSNSSVKGKPLFVKKDPVSIEIDTKLLSFEQVLSPLLCTNRGIETLVYADRKPVAVSLSYGKGRVGICAAGRLFMEYGRLPERKLGKTDHIISAQKELLVHWLKWLAENSPSRQIPSSGYENSIAPEIRISGNNIDVYCIPPLRTVAKDLLAKWELVWEDFSEYTGLSSPLEFVQAAKPGDKLQVYLRSAEAGGLSGGTRISVPGAGEERSLIAVLGHEVGHKLLSGINISMNEAWAEWMACRGLRANGFHKEASEKLRSHIADFREIDPTGTKLDIADKLSDIKQSKACQGKWMWILTELEGKYGDGVLGRYTKYYVEDPARRDKASPQGRGRTARITMADVNRYMSKAVGQDLTSWFRSLGITVTDTPLKK